MGNDRNKTRAKKGGQALRVQRDYDEAWTTRSSSSTSRPARAAHAEEGRGLHRDVRGAEAQFHQQQRARLRNRRRPRSKGLTRRSGARGGGASCAVL